MALSQQDVFNIDFHQFMDSEKDQSSMELAQEFGLSLKDVKNLKEKLNRS
ncbi:RNA polymerase subunit sigma-70 [Salinibacillus xinjiangensis]|uniref:RNA polymerase subunit sigma-70 n=2 Tax=Salinibacillus xinjiangensis TaxID=1229268 RepID=A0A6G1XBF2_9BACI|nr:RNA polymerase subunit sigma-70 [Salinibacillus xinjiangensis]MRG88262.1 RNA polymerase subunit sigma-70 [Salinibacillus xinjiangensis]